MDSTLARTAHIRKIVADIGGPTAFANTYGNGRWSQAQVSQWCSEERPKPIGRALARDLERVIQLREGSLDLPPGYLQGQSASVVNYSRRKIPLVSLVQAGRAKEVIDDYTVGDASEYIDVDDLAAGRLGPNALALRLEGLSMWPDYGEGDIVIIDPGLAVRPGDIVVAKVNRDKGATIKKYRDRGGDRFDLVPINEDYATESIGPDNPGHIIGVVVEHRRTLRR